MAGGYDKEEKAARAYDLAALKYWGTSTTTNFPVSSCGYFVHGCQIKVQSLVMLSYRSVTTRKSWKK